MSGTVYLIDDDVSYLSALTRWMRAQGLAVESFSSADALLARVGPESGGCLITDLRMPGLGGRELQLTLSARGCELPVIFLTGQGDIPTSVQAMRDGAEDFLEKNAPREELIAAVRRALARDVAGREQQSRQRDARLRLDKLTEREREVLALVLRGSLNKQIAAELGICERTVKLHRTSITTKLGVPSVAELARLAQLAGVIST